MFQTVNSYKNITDSCNIGTKIGFIGTSGQVLGDGVIPPTYFPDSGAVLQVFSATM